MRKLRAMTSSNWNFEVERFCTPCNSILRYARFSQRYSWRDRLCRTVGRDTGEGLPSLQKKGCHLQGRAVQAVGLALKITALWAYGTPVNIRHCTTRITAEGEPVWHCGNSFRVKTRSSSFRTNCKSSENCALLGNYAANTGNLLLTFRDNLSVPYSGATFRDKLNVGKKWSLLAA